MVVIIVRSHMFDYIHLLMFTGENRNEVGRRTFYLISDRSIYALLPGVQLGGISKISEYIVRRIYP